MKTITIEEAAAAFRAGHRVSYTRKGGREVVLREIKAGYPKGQPRYGFTSSGYDDDSVFTALSPEESINAAMTEEARPREILVSEPVARVAVTPVSPPLVPLGPNRTRDGREARVICNDRAGTEPVVALVMDSNRIEYTHSFGPEGSYVEGQVYRSDLVGHLPPEPVKPREIWLCENLDGSRCIAHDCPQELAPGRKQTHFREVTSETETLP